MSSLGEERGGEQSSLGEEGGGPAGPAGTWNPKVMHSRTLCGRADRASFRPILFILAGSACPRSRTRQPCQPSLQPNLHPRLPALLGVEKGAFQEAGPHCGGQRGAGSTHFTASQKCSSFSSSFLWRWGSRVPDILGVRDETACPTLRTNPDSEQSPQWPCQSPPLSFHPSPPPACLRVFCPEPPPPWRVAMGKKVTTRKNRSENIKTKIGRDKL